MTPGGAPASRRSRLSPALLAALLVLVIVACGEPPPEGFRPLWPEEWSWHHHGELWVRGVPADGRRVEGRRGELLRVAALNLGVSQARVELRGARSTTVQLGPGERRHLEVDLRHGVVEVEAPPEVVLVEPRAGRPRRQPRLLVVALADTLRADHVTPELMPRITGYFADGRRFSNATANCSWTIPSVASLFTSRPVLDLTAPDGDLLSVPEGADTWTTALAASGFSGMAAVANYSVAVVNGFGQGFSTYLVPDGHGDDPHPDASWVVGHGRTWLAEHRGEDGFLYLHFMDPHHPYRSHDDPTLVAPDLISLANRQRVAGPGERELLARLYAGEVRHLDRILGAFLGELPASATVVFTSDHGESLGERGCWGHGLNLYQESLLVPLLIHSAGLEPGTSDRLVDHLDTAPTLLHLMAVAAPPAMTGASLLVDGPSRPVVSTTFGSGPLRWARRDGDIKAVLHLAGQPGLGASARSRMVEGSPLPAGLAFFDLARDPGELAAVDPGAERLARTGEAFAGTAGRLVSGLQLQVWASPGPVTLELPAGTAAAVVQAWSTAGMTARETAAGLTVSCADAAVLCAVGLSVPSPPDATTVRRGAAEVVVLELGSPAATGLWWNDPRVVVESGHEETLERLRALGYIE